MNYLQSWHQLNTKAFVVHIPIDRIIFQLYSLNAPNAVMHFYLTKIDDFNRRLAIARKTKVHKSIIDSLQGLKNKDELERFKMTLSNGSEEYYYAENAIKTLVQLVLFNMTNTYLNIITHTYLYCLFF